MNMRFFGFFSCVITKSRLLLLEYLEIRNHRIWRNLQTKKKPTTYENVTRTLTFIEIILHMVQFSFVQ